jgi:hypothetical protein
MYRILHLLPDSWQLLFPPEQKAVSFCAHRRMDLIS